MFRCGKCGESKQRGDLVVLETRPKVYTETRWERGREITETLGQGTEIVREERWCEDCIGPYERPTRIAVAARLHGR
jgi:hypothetical protein